MPNNKLTTENRKQKTRIVVLTGAGISAESGIQTFRGAGGLWEGHDIYEVASPQGYAKNPKLVLDFYNARRKNLLSVKPNAGHFALADLEKHFDVHIITQNVDDLHERAGSTKVLHLHGELFKAQSTKLPELVYEWEKDLNLGDKCELGSQLRPFIVWFGEQVPKMDEAIAIAAKADIFLVVGTSLVVYPAAGLLNYVKYEVPKYIIDPEIPEVYNVPNVEFMQATATQGVPTLAKKLVLGVEG
ncbi:MAG: NAD-dependent deacylase [Chitinophagales bacterium]|nr:NAD-dependent deacylase [Chitinophagales bacterium]